MKPEILLYILKSVAISGILLFLYVLFQRNEKTYSFNRFFLLMSLILIVVLPLIHIDTFYILSETNNNYSLFEETLIEPTIKSSKQAILIETTLPKNIIEKNINWYFIVYMLLTTILIVRFIANLYKIFNSVKANNSIRCKGYKVVLLKNSISPFSFLQYIFMNQKDAESKDFENLIFHEIGHIKHKHSLDICLLELVQAIMWFNPFLILLKREVKLIHEYQADNHAILFNENIDSYKNALINQVFRNNHMILASGFNFLFTKNRLKMITKNDSNFISKFIKKTITLSVTIMVALILISFNNTEKLHASLKQSSLNTIDSEPVELNGKLVLNYPEIPVVKIQDISDFKILELIKNGKVHFKITNYGNDVFLIEKEVQKLNSGYELVLKDFDDKVFHGKLDVIQNREPNIKYYAMYNGELRRTLKMYDCMAFEGNYPAKKLNYIINNEAWSTENFNLNSSNIDNIKISYLDQKLNDWKIEIETKEESISEFDSSSEQESFFVQTEHEKRESESLKENIQNSNLAIRVALSKPPMKKEDWETTEYYSQERPGKNIEFHRNGAKVIIKRSRVDFMDDGYFRTGPFLVRLEQDKLIISTNKDIDKLTLDSENLEKNNQEIHLNGSSELALNDEFIFKANEIVVISN
jgi:hypothetical protein